MGSVRKRLETLPEGWLEQVRRDYRYGYTLQHLGRVYGVTYGTLGKWLSDVEPPSRHTTGYERLVDLRENVLRDYLEEGVGMRELKWRFGVHEGTMRSFLQAQGVLKTRGAQQGEHNPQSKAGRVTSKERDAGKYWARRVVEQVLGRPLAQEWVIHHMNECPTDQTPSNLWLFPSTSLHSQYHQRQRENLTSGGQLSPSRLALDIGGLWWPQILDRLQDEPETVLRDLCGTPE